MNKQQIIANADERTANRLALLARDGVLRVFAAAEEAGLLRGAKFGLASPGEIFVRDILDAAEVEPRVLEILPALLLKTNRLVQDEENLPKDLTDIIWKKMRPETFRGMHYQRWIEE